MYCVVCGIPTAFSFIPFSPQMRMDADGCERSFMKDTACDCKMACTSKELAFKEAELYSPVGNSLHRSFWCLLTSLKSYYNTFFLDKDIFWTPSCTKKKISTPGTERTSHIACSSGKCVELCPQGVWSDTWHGYKRLIPTFLRKRLGLRGLPSKIVSSF